MAKKINYQDAMTEIESILHEMESNEPDIDSLTKKVKRVSELLTFCKNKLRNTEEEIGSILDSLDEDI